VVDRVRGLLAESIGELAIRDVDVPVTRHRDVRELDVMHGLAQLERARERLAVVGRADEVDARVEAARTITREACPREVNVSVAGTAAPVDLDRRLVVELAEQVRRRGAGPNVERPNELLAVVGC